MVTDQRELVERLERALAAFDEADARCPINHPKPGEPPERDGQCARCGARSNESCRTFTGAASGFIKEARAALTEKKEG